MNFAINNYLLHCTFHKYVSAINASINIYKYYFLTFKKNYNLQNFWKWSFFFEKKSSIWGKNWLGKKIIFIYLKLVHWMSINIICLLIKNLQFTNITMYIHKSRCPFRHQPWLYLVQKICLIYQKWFIKLPNN